MSGMAAPGRQIGVQLSDEEYTLLEKLAAKRDSTVSELIRLAIRHVYMSDLERDVTPLEVHRLAETSLLADEEEREIGISGPGLLPQDEERAAD
jgi:predicted transcriptional regulator